MNRQSPQKLKNHPLLQKKDANLPNLLPIATAHLATKSRMSQALHRTKGLHLLQLNHADVALQPKHHQASSAPRVRLSLVLPAPKLQNKQRSNAALQSSQLANKKSIVNSSRHTDVQRWKKKSDSCERRKKS
jgi:hypothetical protein